jgi:hypothetical protein
MLKASTKMKMMVKKMSTILDRTSTAPPTNSELSSPAAKRTAGWRKERQSRQAAQER